ncbi:MAG TPA: TA system VapC family ribonuclease toxin [Thermoanaerobaculia bacterium]|nr:TA system VapC family ribonuclease toxin [Thermoanaerobaculia bacterium]
MDVNVLVALAWPNHEHHEFAVGWLEENQAAGWATCPVTQSGFIRVSSNARAIPGAKSPHQTISLLREMVSLPHHVFLPDDTSLVSSEFVTFQKVMGYRQVTDAHVLGIALRHGAALVTFDRSILDLVPPGYAAGEVVCLLTKGE